MGSTLCNSACTLSLQPIAMPGGCSGFAGEHKGLASSQAQDVQQQLPDAHQACAPPAGQDVIVLMDSCWQEVLSPPKATESSPSWNLILPSLQILPSWRPCGTSTRPTLGSHAQLWIDWGELQMLSASLSLGCPHFQLFRQLWMNQKTKHKREKKFWRTLF